VHTSLLVHRRNISEALRTGLSRPPRNYSAQCYPLSSFCKVVRGIASGANEFFFLTKEQIHELGLDKRFFVRAIGRTRDCSNSVLTTSILEELSTKSRPTWLLNLGDVAESSLPKRMKDYLNKGVKSGFSERALIKSRRPWYKMERRSPPAILFAYLGRRDCRFILNQANVVPLTGFLCVYPINTDKQAIRKLWQALNHPDTLSNLQFVGKSYGNGALKVEPRQLDSLEIPLSVLDEVGLAPPPTASQLKLLDKPGRYKSNRMNSGKKLKP
jgi:adenine-specific DNA-methyltransferase